MGCKEQLAFEVVKQLSCERDAEKAQERWINLFSKKEISAVELPELKLGARKISALDLVLASGVAKSKSEARRLILGGAVELAGAVKKNPNEMPELQGGEILKVGKRRFFKIKI